MSVNAASIPYVRMPNFAYLSNKAASRSIMSSVLAEMRSPARPSNCQLRGPLADIWSVSADLGRGSGAAKRERTMRPTLACSRGISLTSPSAKSRFAASSLLSLFHWCCRPALRNCVEDTLHGCLARHPRQPYPVLSVVGGNSNYKDFHAHTTGGDRFWLAC